MGIKLFDRKHKKILFKRTKMIIYKIFYKEWQIFDIELMLVQSDINPNEYASDIKCDVVPEGIAHFIFEKAKKVEDLEYAIKSAIRRGDDINKLRTVLYESLDWDNNPLPLKEAEERHYKVFKPFFEKEMNNYCKEFGLGMITD